MHSFKGDLSNMISCFKAGLIFYNNNILKTIIFILKKKTSNFM